MQGNNPSTLCTGPFLFFFQEILFCAHGLYTNGVLDQTDLISLPIAFIQPLDDTTGKGCAFKAEVNAAAGSTVSNVALPAMVRLASFLPSAALTSLLFLEMHIANHAIHPTWRQQAY
jgi:hypothetical protein